MGVSAVFWVSFEVFSGCFLGPRSALVRFLAPLRKSQIGCFGGQLLSACDRVLACEEAQFLEAGATGATGTTSGGRVYFSFHQTGVF